MAALHGSGDPAYPTTIDPIDRGPMEAAMQTVVRCRPRPETAIIPQNLTQAALIGALDAISTLTQHVDRLTAELAELRARP